MIFGCAVAHAVSPPVGAGLGFGLFVAGVTISAIIARTPETRAPRFWGRNVYAARLWYLAFYSGNQLRRDLNLTVGVGKNWRIPHLWPFLIRYISAPILAIIYSFAYPGFCQLRDDPLHIFGFSLAHLVLIVIGLGVVLPRWFDVFIPPHRRDDGKVMTAVHVSPAAVEAMKMRSWKGETVG